jgi:hypothetical protein
MIVDNRRIMTIGKMIVGHGQIMSSGKTIASHGQIMIGGKMIAGNDPIVVKVRIIADNDRIMVPVMMIADLGRMIADRGKTITLGKTTIVDRIIIAILDTTDGVVMMGIRAGMGTTATMVMAVGMAMNRKDRPKHRLKKCRNLISLSSR